MNNIIDLAAHCWEHCKEAIMVVSLGLFGGTANYVKLVRRGIIPQGIGAFIGHIAISGFSAWMGFALARWVGVENMNGLAVCAGIASYGGIKFIEILEAIAQEKLMEKLEASGIYDEVTRGENEKG